MYLGKYYIINIGFISKTLNFHETTKIGTWVAQSTSLKLQRNIIHVLHSFLDKAEPQI